MSNRTIAFLFLAALATACSSTSKKKDLGDEFADLQSPVARAKVQARVDNIKYQRGVILIANLERIAAYGPAAIPTCIKNLKDDEPMTRMGCAWVLGRVGDIRTIPYIEPLLKDDVDYVRYEAASSLGSMGDRQGFSVLVEGLSSDRIDFRFRCIEALKDFTGRDFGYKHNEAPEVRKVSVERWESWLDRMQSEEL
jgi:HEAT repeat protein